MIIKRNGSLTTGTTLNPNNVWSGSAFEYLKGPALVAIGLITPTTYALSGLLSACYVGASLIAEEYIVPNIDPAIYGQDTALMSDNYLIQAGAWAATGSCRRCAIPRRARSPTMASRSSRPWVAGAAASQWPIHRCKPRR